ncbi:MAG: hypothetical protein O7B81_16970 [Gammaproteobacteria bacterium]|nr:hypothetical protein [Gammaproteobacteria bacterium]
MTLDFILDPISLPPLTVSECDVLVFRSGVVIDEALLDTAPSLALIIRAGSGTDNIDLEMVGNRGIRFERIPGPGAIK